MNKLLGSHIQVLNKIYQENGCKPTEIVKACYDRIAKTRKCNAFITLTPKIAETQANACEERQEREERLGPLDGITIAVKDNFCTASVNTTCGSRMLENFVPTYNATVYDKLSKSGAILLGKTNLDQFGMGSGTVDSIYGPTRNIYGLNWDDDNFYISGGSSGGSAVAVASDACFAALGSDTGGSVRNPATYCGVVGLKPTYGLVSRFGLIPLVHSMDVPGIITRSVDDCVQILHAIAGPDPKDSTTLKRTLTPFTVNKSPRIAGLKVGIPKEYHCEGLSEEVHETWKMVADLLEEGGATVKEVSMPHTKYSIVCYSILNQCEVASNMACYDGIEFGLRASDCEESTEKLYALSRSLGFNSVVKTRIITGNYFLLQRNYEKYFNKALKVRRLISNDFDAVFEDFHVLLTPTTLSTAPKIQQFLSMNNRDQCAMQDFCTQPANMAGIPAITIPIRLSGDNMPIGLQIMSRNLSENVLLTVAKYIENVVQFPKLNLEL